MKANEKDFAKQYGKVKPRVKKTKKKMGRPKLNLSPDEMKIRVLAQTRIRQQRFQVRQRIKKAEAGHKVFGTFAELEADLHDLEKHYTGNRYKNEDERKAARKERDKQYSRKRYWGVTKPVNEEDAITIKRLHKRMKKCLHWSKDYIDFDTKGKSDFPGQEKLPAGSIVSPSVGYTWVSDAVKEDKREELDRLQKEYRDIIGKYK